MSDPPADPRPPANRSAPGPAAAAGRLTVGEVRRACRTARHCLERGENPGCWTAALAAAAMRWGATDRAAALFPASGAVCGAGVWAGLGRASPTRGRRVCAQALRTAAARVAAEVTAPAIPAAPGAAGRATAGLTADELPAPPPRPPRGGAAADARVCVAVAWRDARGRTAVLLIGAPPAKPAAKGAADRAAAADGRADRAGKLARVAARELALIGDRLTHPGEPAPGELGRRARAVLHHWLDGRLEKEVATTLHVSDSSVHKQVNRLYRYFGVSSRGQLQARFLRNGWGRRRDWRTSP